MKLPFLLDDGAASKAALGLIVLQMDETLEAELRTVFNQPGVALFHTRIPSAEEITPQTLMQMENELPAIAGLLPSTHPLDVVGYGCTSGATIIGSDKIAALVNQVHPAAKVTDPIKAVIAALQHLNISKIGFITPYVAEVSEAMRDLLSNNGISVSGVASFEQSRDPVVARISPASILDAIIATGEDDNIDAVFVSCTNLRCFDIIEQAEEKIRKPVISSNQALAWHMLKLAGLPTWSMGPGRLFGS
ncbi:MAG: Asp/Glu racemase [Hyphomicrobiales bacterium]|nr:MAG: Asp/Glu racemase [Hyphomicrobiales bacterium]